MLDASGYAIVDENGIDVRSVSPTVNAAKVNWLATRAGCLILEGASDQEISDLFARKSGGHASVIRVAIQNTASASGSCQKCEEDSFNYDGAIEDLKSIGNHMIDLLAHPEDRARVAWWMCANYAPDIAKSPHRELIQALAEVHGAPPKGGTWDKWFEKVRMP
jgi:hypothetical protein